MVFTDKTYKIELNDGTIISGLALNGTNFVSNTEIDTSIFEDNLNTVKVYHGDDLIYNWKYVEFIQQVHYDDGYYFCFRELSEEELRYNNIIANMEYLAMMSDIDLEG